MPVLYNSSNMAKLECLDCFKCFTSAEDLDHHICFMCTLCSNPKTYPSKLRLETHIKAFHGEKLFQCELCESKFSHQYKLQSHRRFVHERIGHSCGSCNKLFMHKVFISYLIFSRIYNRLVCIHKKNSGLLEPKEVCNRAVKC